MSFLRPLLLTLLLWQDSSLAAVNEARLREIIGESMRNSPIGKTASRKDQAPINHYRRFTDESRAMSLLNDVVQRALSSDSIFDDAEKLDLASKTFELHSKFASDPNLLALSKRSQSVLSRCDKNWDVDCSWFEYLPFRTITGLCNNLGKGQCSKWKTNQTLRKLWGASHIPLKRYISDKREPKLEDLQKHYFDRNLDISNGKNNDNNKSNSDLPEPREVSVAFHQHQSNKDGVFPESKNFSHMVMQFGQFLDHDVTLVPEEEHEDCCTNNDPDKCMNLYVGNDKFYSDKGVSCMAMRRSVTYCKGASKKNEPMNALTAFVDASNVYGSDIESARQLRSFAKGHLLVSKQKNADFLPFLSEKFACGDARCGEQPALLSIHALFVREHNRVADLLPNYSPTWRNDELRYQMARRIVGAEMQNIVYNHFLPVVLGDEYEKYDLDSSSWSSYDSCTNPSIANAFATAAFRFGHTLVQSRFAKCDIRGETNKCAAFDLRNNFDDPKEATSPKGLDSILFGQTLQPSQEYDRLIVPDLVNFLFAHQHNFAFGEDLAARNIRRGRDHNLASWKQFREACALQTPHNWNDRPHDISEDNWKILKSLYKSPGDIDLFPGGLAESRVSNGVVGKTFACILGQQFKELKFGDRFFFTHKRTRARFSRRQLRVLMKRTLRDVLCDNTDIKKIVLDVFRLENESNPWDDCVRRNDLRVDILADIEGVSLPAVEILLQSPHTQKY